MAVVFGSTGQGNGGPCRTVGPNEGAKIHAIELVRRKNDYVGESFPFDVAEVVSEGIRRALVPVACLIGLLGGQGFDEASVKRVGLVGVGDMTMKRCALVLGQDENSPNAGVDAVTDGDINEAVFAGQRHRGNASAAC